jgi:hypothetical protein
MITEIIKPLSKKARRIVVRAAINEPRLTPKNQLIETHKNLQSDEKKIFEGLNEKYGDGNYDPATNTFIPVEKTQEKVTKIKK